MDAIVFDSQDIAALCRVTRNTLTRAQRLHTSMLCRLPRQYTGTIIEAVTNIETIARNQVDAAEDALRRV